MVFADLVDDPADCFTDLKRLIRVHIEQVTDTLLENLGEGDFLRTLRYGSECNKGGITILPGLVQDVLGHKRNNRLNNVVA